MLPIFLNLFCRLEVFILNIFWFPAVVNILHFLYWLHSVIFQLNTNYMHVTGAYIISGILRKSGPIFKTTSLRGMIYGRSNSNKTKFKKIIKKRENCILRKLDPSQHSRETVYSFLKPQ